MDEYADEDGNTAASHSMLITKCTLTETATRTTPHLLRTYHYKSAPNKPSALRRLGYNSRSEGSFSCQTNLIKAAGGAFCKWWVRALVSPALESRRQRSGARKDHLWRTFTPNWVYEP
jgi:hypothetical protein